LFNSVSLAAVGAGLGAGSAVVARAPAVDGGDGAVDGAVDGAEAHAPRRAIADAVRAKRAALEKLGDGKRLGCMTGILTSMQDRKVRHSPARE